MASLIVTIDSYDLETSAILKLGRYLVSYTRAQLQRSMLTGAMLCILYVHRRLVLVMRGMDDK